MLLQRPSRSSIDLWGALPAAIEPDAAHVDSTTTTGSTSTTGTSSSSACSTPQHQAEAGRQHSLREPEPGGLHQAHPTPAHRPGSTRVVWTRPPSRLSSRSEPVGGVPIELGAAAAVVASYAVTTNRSLEAAHAVLSLPHDRPSTPHSSPSTQPSFDAAPSGMQVHAPAPLSPLGSEGSFSSGGGGRGGGHDRHGPDMFGLINSCRTWRELRELERARSRDLLPMHVPALMAATSKMYLASLRPRRRGQEYGAQQVPADKEAGSSGRQEAGTGTDAEADRVQLLRYLWDLASSALRLARARELPPRSLSTAVWAVAKLPLRGEGGGLQRHESGAGSGSGAGAAPGLSVWCGWATDMLRCCVPLLQSFKPQVGSAHLGEGPGRCWQGCGHWGKPGALLRLWLKCNGKLARPSAYDSLGTERSRILVPGTGAHTIITTGIGPPPLRAAPRT